MNQLNNKEKSELVIPSIIEFCRYEGANLRPSQLYFLNTNNENNQARYANRPILNYNAIQRLLNDLKINMSLELVVSGDFINPKDLKYRGIDESQFKLNVLKQTLQNEKLTFLKDYRSYNDEELINSGKYLALHQIRSFWQTMLDYEILHLNRGINDLGFDEWNNFGINIYNNIVSSDNKSLIFKEVNKILTYIIYPSNLIESTIEKEKTLINIRFINVKESLNSVEIKVNKHDSLQQLLDFLYVNFLFSKVPKHTYEKNWILENNGCFIRKGMNKFSQKLADFRILDGAELNLFVLR